MAMLIPEAGNLEEYEASGSRGTVVFRASQLVDGACGDQASGAWILECTRLKD